MVASMLVDRFGRTIEYLRISVTDRCNLRCDYCMPKGFRDFERPENWLSLDELMRVIQTFVKLGTRRFRLTGGEPLVRKDLVDMVTRIRHFRDVEDISLTTNGTLLPTLAEPLFRAGLNRLNVSLDSLDRKTMESITGKDCFQQVMEGLHIAQQVGFKKIKINMVVMPDRNLDEVAQMLEFCMEKNFILCLIEVMPMGETGQNRAGINLQSVIQKLREPFGLSPSSQRIGNGPARYWENRSGKVCLGLITPLSQHFCETCNRVRLSVDGTLFMCLGQESSFALRPLLREPCGDKALESAIRQAIELKPQAHDFLRQPTKIRRIMSRTGG